MTRLFPPLSSLPRESAKWLLRHTWYRSAVYRPQRADRPFLVRLDITNRCNLRCRKCFYPDYADRGLPARPMSVADFRLLAGRLFDYTYLLQLGCAFESLMHPDYPEILSILDAHAIPHVGMVTNGTLLRGARAEAVAACRSMRVLSVSLDGIEPATFAALRGRALLPQVLENIESFLALRASGGRPGPQVNINTRIMRSNLAELPRLADWCAQHRVDNLQMFHVTPFGGDNEESAARAPAEWNAARLETLAAAERGGLALRLPPPLPLDAAASQSDRQPQEPGTDAADGYCAGLPPHPYPTGLACICPWMTLAIDCEGNIAPCSPRHDFRYGNLLRQDLFHAVNSIRILRLRRALLAGRGDRACPDCRPALTPYADPMRRRQPLDRPDPSKAEKGDG